MLAFFGFFIIIIVVANAWKSLKTIMFELLSIYCNLYSLSVAFYPQPLKLQSLNVVEWKMKIFDFNW